MSKKRSTISLKFLDLHRAYDRIALGFASVEPDRLLSVHVIEHKPGLTRVVSLESTDADLILRITGLSWQDQQTFLKALTYKAERSEVFFLADIEAELHIPWTEPEGSRRFVMRRREESSTGSLSVYRTIFTLVPS